MEGTHPRWLRAAATALLAVWGVAILRDPGHTVLHLVILPIHEAGHIFFTPLGEFAHFLGGSLFQVAFPVAFIVYFWRQKDRWAATIPLWFTGVSAADLSVYIKDAHSGDLELIGGEHDWSWILSRLTLVHRDQEIGQAVFLVGLLCIVAAVWLGLYWLPEREASAA
jgi:hypothetical protein